MLRTAFRAEVLREIRFFGQGVKSDGYDGKL